MDIQFWGISAMNVYSHGFDAANRVALLASTSRPLIPLILLLCICWQPKVLAMTP
jgi:hypothetical protein